MSDQPAYETRCYRVVWYFRIGTWGDSEGRTWAKELDEETPFPTKEAAEDYRDSHPAVEHRRYGKDQSFGSWRTKKPYGKVGIYRTEEPIEPAICPSTLAAAAKVAENEAPVTQDFQSDRLRDLAERIAAAIRKLGEGE